MRKLIVTGASGFLGYNLCKAASGQGWKVIGIGCTKKPHLGGAIDSIVIDLRDYRAVKELISTLRPNAIIHCAAASDPNFCQKNPAESRKINVDATANLASLSAELSIQFIFTSSDLVFNGTAPPYKETDPVAPINIYGEQKVEAEKRVLLSHEGAKVCRMALMFGEPGPGAKSFIQPFISTLMKGEELRLFTDEYRSILGIKSACAGLLLALETSSGILHLAGPASMSRYQFGLLLAKRLSRTSQIVAAKRADIPMPAPRPADVSLDISKAYSIGFRPLSIEQELDAIKLPLHSR